MKIIVLCGVIALFTLACTQKDNKIHPDENMQLFFFFEKNHDISMKDTLFLTAENVKYVQKYVKTNFSSFELDNEEFFGKYQTDDSVIDLFVKEFNDNGPDYCTIYFSGIAQYAGYSSVIGWLNINPDNETELWSYHFFVDEEYSDLSGIMFCDVELRTEDNTRLSLWRNKYTDTGNYYWEVHWPLNDFGKEVEENDEYNGVIFDDYEIFQLFTKDEKAEILFSFLSKLPDAKVYENIDISWFKDIYTGIYGNRQRIRDIIR